MAELSVADLVREIERQQPGATTPLPHLTAAVLAAEHLAEVGDGLVDHFVQQARAAGASWSDIGQCMGVSKQAAQQRFVAERETGEPEYLEEFTTGVRRAVALAEDEARAAGHRYVGTEHLLLGLLRDAGPTARLLEERGVSLAVARERALAKVGRGEGAAAGRLPITPRARKVLELALREARHRGVAAPTPDDVLLGLVREGKGVAAQVLREVAGDLGAIRARLLQS